MLAPDSIVDSMTFHSGRFVLVAPPVAAMCYPFLLKLFHGVVTPPNEANVRLAAVALLLAISVPAIGIDVRAKQAHQSLPRDAPAPPGSRQPSDVD